MSATRLDLPGAWYTDALPSGAYAALYGDSRIRTWRGDVPLPPGGNLLYLRCHESRGLCIAGQGHNDGRAWLWADEQWHDLGETYGTSPCAFGPEGVYISHQSAFDNIGVIDIHTRKNVRVLTQPVGSRGIAHVDDNGIIHSVDDWYGRDGFAEYTDIGTVQIGQGAQGGIVARVNGGPLRLVEPGSVQFIRASQDGDTFSVAAWKDREGGAVIHWLIIAELDALPLVSDVSPPPIVIPPITPEPVLMAFPNILSTLSRARAEYPALITTEQAVEILNTVAWQHSGFGLLAKPNGNHGPQPKTGIFCSADWLVHLPSGRGTDCFINGPSIDAGNSGEAGLQWNDEGEPFDVSRFVAPVEPEGVVDPGPGPGPVPTSALIDTRALQAKIASLDASVAGLLASSVGMTSRIAAIEARPQTGAEPLRRVAIKSSRGRYLRDDHGDDIGKFDRDAAGDGETYELVPQ